MNKIQLKRVFALTDEEVLEFIADLPISCTLDMADKGAITLDGVARSGYKNIERELMTRERVRQMEVSALKKVKKRMKYLDFNAFTEVAFVNQLREIEVDTIELRTEALELLEDHTKF